MNLWNERAWNGYCALPLRPYFRRRWIIEEVALSQDPWLVCGGKLLAWDVFLTGYIRCGGALFDSRHKQGPGVRSTESESTAGIRILRYRRSNGINTSLFELLTRFRRCDSVKLRDRVYAFMGICDPGEMVDNRVNYRAETEEIFIRQVLVHIEAYDNLDVLNVCNQDQRTERLNQKYKRDGLEVLPDDPNWARVTLLPNLPTWTPNWTSPRTYWLLGPESKALVDLFRPVFDASGGTRAKVINLTTAAQSRVLQVRGMEISTVGRVEQSTPPPNPDQLDPCSNFYNYCWITCHAFPLGHTPYRTEGERFGAFLRTITAGGRRVGANYILTDEFLEWWCLEFFQDPRGWNQFGQILGSLGYHRRPKPPHNRFYEKPEAAARFPASDPPSPDLNKLPYFRFFVSQNGRMGLGPPQTQVGDKICILFGCSSPLSLYPSPSRIGHYCIRGESYMHGLMSGEAIQMLQAQILTEQTFSLC